MDGIWRQSHKVADPTYDCSWKSKSYADNLLICGVSSAPGHSRTIAASPGLGVTRIPAHLPELPGECGRAQGGGMAGRSLECVEVFVVMGQILRIEGWHGQCGALLVPAASS